MRNTILQASLAEKTRVAYTRFWNRFKDFVVSSTGLFLFPSSSNHVSLFVAQLFKSGLAPSTISSHLSAISYFHQIAGHEDPCNQFIIRRMLLGCRKLKLVQDTRLPLLSHHISGLIHAVDNLYVSNRYQKLLTRAIILIAYHGFFRLGELLPARLDRSQEVVQFQHVQMSVSSVQIQLSHHKTQRSGKPITIIISSEPKLCPVQALKRYLACRGDNEGPLFISSTIVPITLAKFRGIFNNLLDFNNMSRSQYKLHSFRIGACTQAILSGVPEHTIMQLGRWKSQAYKRYIRVPHLSMSKDNSS